MNTTQLMHVSPDMIDQEDMKNWNPEQWTRHLQEQVDLPRVNCHIYIMKKLVNFNLAHATVPQRSLFSY